MVLSGALLGADAALGGVDQDADTFGAGSISRVSIGGDVSGGVIAAGLDPVDDLINNGDDAIIGDSLVSAIAKLSIRGMAESDSYFAAAAIRGKVKIGGATIDPATDTRFMVL
jgi:hypothetical protein